MKQFFRTAATGVLIVIGVATVVAFWYTILAVALVIVIFYASRLLLAAKDLFNEEETPG